RRNIEVFPEESELAAASLLSSDRAALSLSLRSFRRYRSRRGTDVSPAGCPAEPRAEASPRSDGRAHPKFAAGETDVPTTEPAAVSRKAGASRSGLREAAPGSPRRPMGRDQRHDDVSLSGMELSRPREVPRHDHGHRDGRD